MTPSDISKQNKKPKKTTTTRKKKDKKRKTKKNKNKNKKTFQQFFETKQNQSLKY